LHEGEVYVGGARRIDFLTLCGAPHNRKNYLFFGSDRGGRTAAVLYSVTASCQRHGVEPWAYLRDVLAKMPTQPSERFDDLLPDRWKAARTSQKAEAKPATEAMS